MSNKKIRRGVSLYIDDKQVKNDVRSIQKEYYKLRNLQKDMTIGSEEYNRTTAKIRKLKGVLDKHNQQLGTTSRRWKGVGTSAASARQMYMKVMGAITAIASSLYGLVRLTRANADLSDSLTDVQKTTGMTNEAVTKLNKNLTHFNTRTPQQELLDLARIAGKLGITGVSNVEGFVKAADKINVALKEDLGGNTEESIRKIGKLVDIFKVKDQFGLEQGMLKIGSAINELGANSTANEEYLVNFSNRMAGIAPNAEISADKVLGLAATLDQLGQREEMSATALGQLFVAMGKDIPKFAGIAGESIEDFSKLLKEDANEAFLRVLEGSKSAGGGLEKMAKSMDALGLDGQRAIQVMGVLSNNTETLREQQALANDAYNKGTSLTEEFNKKNTNLAAMLAKIGKRIRNAFVNSRFLSGIEKAVGWVERWTRSKLADIIRDEADEVNQLAVKLTNSNTKEEDRRKILKKLKDISPDIVEGLEAENLNVSKLKDNMKQYNKQLIKRISLANLQEEEERKLSQLADARTKQSEAQIKISKLMMDANQELALSEGTFEEKLKRVTEYLKENAAGRLQVTQYGAAVDHRNKEAKLLQEIGVLYEHYNSKLQKGNELEAETKGIQKRNEELKKLLGINEEMQQQNESPGGNEDDEDDEGNPTKVVDDDEVKKQEKLLERLQASIKSFRQKLFLNSKSGKEKELAELDLWHEEMIAKSKEANADTSEIEKLYADKKAAINDKYEQERIEKKKEVQGRISEIMMDDKQKEIHEITEKYQELIDLAEEFGIDTVELYRKMQEEIDAIGGGEEGEPTLFGMSVSEVEKLAGEISRITGELGGSIMNIWSNVNAHKNNLDRREMNDYERMIERKKDVLNKQLDQGIISEEQYTARVAKLDSQLESKKEEIAVRQAERDKKASKFAAYINAAEAITEIWSKHASNPVYAGILTALTVAATAAQIKAIESQPVPEYAEGGYTDGDRVYRAGEQGREWIASNRMVSDPVTGPIIDSLEAFQRNRIGRDAMRESVAPSYVAMKQAATGMTQNNVVNNYNVDNEMLSLMVEELRALKEDNKKLNEYLSDPQNRRAVISSDLQNDYDEEISMMREMSEIK